MKQFPIIFFILVLFFGLSSCQKNIDSLILDPIQNTADTVWNANVASNAAVVSLKNDLRLANVTDSFSYSNSGMVVSSGNLTLSIPANGLVKNNGLTPSGFINRESLLIYKKGDFIMLDIPTTTNGRLLIAGGAFFIGLKNNNDDLVVAQGNKLTVKFNSTLLFAGNKIFNRSQDSTNGFNWVQNNDTTYNKSFVTNNGYEIQTNKLKHVLTAHYLDTSGVTQTNVSLKLPANYTNANTIAYLSFNNMETVVRFNANVGLRAFVSPSLPINKSATIVVISKQAGDYYLGTQQITTGTSLVGSSYQTLSITPIKKSLLFIKSYLNDL